MNKISKIQFLKVIFLTQEIIRSLVFYSLYFVSPILKFSFKILDLVLIIPFRAALFQLNIKKLGRHTLLKYSSVKLIGGKSIVIGDNFVSGMSLRLEAININNERGVKINIGNNVQINDFCHIGSINLVKIGDGCLIASKVFITDHSHGNTNYTEIEPEKRDLISKGKVIIGKNVWIGESVVILPNVTIGDNCIIGANSVVTKSFPNNSIIAGVPARLIKLIE